VATQTPDRADPEVCKVGFRYEQFTCSPPVTPSTPATLTWNNFTDGGDGGAKSECDDKFHADNELVVALSTGWFNKMARCFSRTGR
jgi:hypothetical protein